MQMSQKLQDAIRSPNGQQLLIKMVQSPARIETNHYNKWGMTPLHMACEMGDDRSVEILLSMGAHPDIPTPDDHGCVTPLVFAATHGRTECVRILLEAGTALDAPDCWGNTPLFKAASYNHLECVRHLLKYGADPNKANKWGALPIQYACLQGYQHIVRLLLEYGADPRERGELSEPQALTSAAMRGHHQCVDLLLTAGMDANYSDNDNGKTALFYAIKYSQHVYRDSLVDPMHANNHNHNRLRCVQSLLNAGASLPEPCVRQLAMECHLLSHDKDYLCIVAMLLKAMPVIPTDELNQILGPLQQLFLAAAKPHEDIFDIAKLLCSIGYKPSQSDVDSIHMSLTGQQLVQLEGFQKNPRALRDLCRLEIRGSLKGNILQTVHELPLPAVLKDYVGLRSPPSYSL